MKKLVAFLLVLIFSAGCFVGCSGESNTGLTPDKNQPNQDGGLPFDEETENARLFEMVQAAFEAYHLRYDPRLEYELAIWAIPEELEKYVNDDYKDSIEEIRAKSWENIQKSAQKKYDDDYEILRDGVVKSGGVSSVFTFYSGDDQKFGYYKQRLEKRDEGYYYQPDMIEAVAEGSAQIEWDVPKNLRGKYGMTWYDEWTFVLVLVDGNWYMSFT